VADGDRVVLQVTAEGPALIYQWQFQGANLLGETGPTLTISAVSQAQAGAYRVIVSNGNGSATSQSADITVQSSATIGRVGGQVSISWGFGVLQTSTDLANWTDVPGSKSPHQPALSDKGRFYRIEVK
jgi:hypothetical protein